MWNDKAEPLNTESRTTRGPGEEIELYPPAEVKLEVNADDKEPGSLMFGVNDVPPLHFNILSALQQALLSISASFTMAFVVAKVVCAEQDELFKAELLSTTMFIAGICTLLQNTVGIRLPLFQGPTIEYIAPLTAVSTASSWTCAVAMNRASESYAWSNSTETPMNSTLIRNQRITELQGSLMLSGVIHVLLGATGLIGVILRFIGPITIVPTLMLIGLYIYKVSVDFSQAHWGISISTTAFGVILSLYLQKKKAPLPFWTRRKGFHIIYYPIHVVFSMLLAILFGWVLSAILTAANVLSDDPDSAEYRARTDSRNSVIGAAKWFFFPYPGYYGVASFSISGFVSFLVATITSIIDSVADYQSCARIVNAPVPPVHAVNRGIFIEGLCTIVAGVLGVAHGTTTFGGNIGAIKITGNGSRRVFQIVGVMYILFGILGKLGAIFVTIPDPVLGGIQLIYFGSFIGVVLSILIRVDLNSTRNITIMGMALLFGMMMPFWIMHHPDAINTGFLKVDETLKAILSNPNFAGGLLACFLDNTVPGTRKERGLIYWKEYLTTEDEELQTSSTTDALGKEQYKLLEKSVYGLPFLPKNISKLKCVRYIPFLPPNE